MALSNSQYQEIMRDYQAQQLKNKHRQDDRIQEIYGKIPAMKELDQAVSTRAVLRAKELLNGDQAALDRLREEIADLREQKAFLLESKGYPADYMEMHYRCPDCRDTAYTPDGNKCHCFRQAQIRLLYAQSNLEAVLRRENFQTFSYQYFDDSRVEPAIGTTVARYMKQVYKWCRDFADRFDEKGGNLLFTGTTGRGKTFLTNCIAKELIDRYHSVIYLSAHDLFEVFSRYRFEYQTEEEMKDMYQFILDCDLLIIDDLGTELNNSFTSSQLFFCINQRLLAGKSTIISTNLSLDRLRDEYTDRVASRIMSNYTIIPLYGEDIRLKI
ncbi:MAG: ATP-binding protein [Lachnospiraceae bacterium]|nr:ATP-binding protein [Lachnospiraceae bacterium]